MTIEHTPGIYKETQIVKQPIERLLDAVAWQPLPTQPPDAGGMPHATRPSIPNPTPETLPDLPRRRKWASKVMVAGWR